MSPPYPPIELRGKIANNLRDDDGTLRYNDFNSFLQVNRTLYNVISQPHALERRWGAGGQHRAYAHALFNSNNLPRLRFFLELDADVEDLKSVFLP
jgi:hypothetical protein